MPKVIGIIPARGGSKGIPRKNIVPLYGKPLISWTIESAIKAENLDHVVVSTEDEEIRDISLACGAEAPFLRPKELARDNIPNIDVLIHAVEWMKKNENVHPEYIVLLQPTSPLRSHHDIDEAIRIALDKKANSVVSVCKVEHHPYKLRCVDENGALKNMYIKPEGYLPRQVYPDVYSVNGAIYVVQYETLINRRILFAECTYPYVMPPERSLDIDDDWDLYLTSLILKDRHMNP